MESTLEESLGSLLGKVAALNLTETNTWLGSNQSTVETAAGTIGDKLNDLEDAMASATVPPALESDFADAIAELREHPAKKPRS